MNITPQDLRGMSLTGLSLTGKKGVEIGPLDRPLVPKGHGTSVYYADYGSSEAVKARYAQDPDVRTDQICDVDFDLSQISFTDVSSKLGPLDYVVASHVIEHVPDLAGWLQDIYASLRPGGILALVVPDKRFTFDVHRRESPYWQIARAHEERRKRPGLWCVIDHVSNVVNISAQALWADRTSAHEARNVFEPKMCQHVIAQWEAGEYIDVHCWTFTPRSFLKTLSFLATQYNLNFVLQSFTSTIHDHLEFYVQLKRPFSGEPPTDWGPTAQNISNGSH